MMNMSPAILNYTVKFNQTVAAVQYNDTNYSFSSLHCVFISRLLRFFTPATPSFFPLRFSSLRCNGFDFRAEVRIRLCFSVILHPHRLKTEREKTINQIYDDHLIEELQSVWNHTSYVCWKLLFSFSLFNYLFNVSLLYSLLKRQISVCTQSVHCIKCWRLNNY